MISGLLEPHLDPKAFFLGVLFGGAVCVAALQYKSRRSFAENVPSSHKNESKPSGPDDTSKGLHSALEDEILSEQFTRNVQFFGGKGQQDILDAFVVVIGLGVGSCCQFMTSACRIYQSPDMQTFGALCLSICNAKPGNSCFRVWVVMQPTCFCGQG